MTNGSKPGRKRPGAAIWEALPGQTRALLGVTGLVVAVLAVWILRQGPGDESRTSPSAADPSAAQAAEPAAGVPAYDPCGLLGFDELDEAMGLLDLPMEQRSIVEFGGGEACTWINDRDGDEVEGLLVRIEPGAVEDFAAGAQLAGVAGDAVSGVGQLAMWFAGERTGTLSVTTESSLGQLFVRITVARPDLEAAAILPVATKVAVTALPRFPGMTAEPEVVVIEHEPPDSSAEGYVDNLLAKEAAGEWTREQGLLASLRLLAGEAKAGEVLRNAELLDASGSGIVAMAREHLAAATAGPATTEIERLLGRLLFTRDELAVMAGQAPQATGAGAVDGDGSAVLAAFRNREPDVPRAAGADPCADQGVPPPCMTLWSSPAIAELDTRYGKGRYQVFVRSNYGELGWSETDLNWIAQALNQSVKTYTPLGRMPAVDIVVLGGGTTDVVVDGGAAFCDVNVYPPLRALGEGHFKQKIAGELALCYAFATFPGKAHQESARWWRDGVAVYLSNVAYPAPRCGLPGSGAPSAPPSGARCDLEWRWLPTSLANVELSRPILKRSSTNAFFFQDLFWSGGNEGIRALLDKLQPAEGQAEEEAVLANHDNMPKRFHEYVLRLTNSVVQDTGTGVMPYVAPADQIEATPGRRVEYVLVPFGTTRLHVTVPEGRKACLETIMRGDVQHSWRYGNVGLEGMVLFWQTIPTDELEDEAILVFTTTKPGGEASVEFKLVEEDESCEPEPTPPTASGCPAILCDPSRFWRQLTDLPGWFVDTLE